MDKDTNKIGNCTQKNAVQLPEILKDGKYYDLLLPNPKLGVRKKLWEACNLCVVPQEESLAIWKNRFLDPGRIPQNGFEYLTKTMSENLFQSLQEQHDTIIELIESKEEQIKRSEEQIINLKDRLSKCHLAIEKFKESDQ